MDKGIKINSLENWKRCAELAITWNTISIARESIFNNANYDHWRVNNGMFFCDLSSELRHNMKMSMMPRNC